MSSKNFTKIPWRGIFFISCNKVTELFPQINPKQRIGNSSLIGTFHYQFFFGQNGPVDWSVIVCSRILILDEMDQLESKHQEILYTMFEWPSLPKSKLILIGK